MIEGPHTGRGAPTETAPLCKENRGAPAETGSPLSVRRPSISLFALMGSYTPLGTGTPFPVPISYDRRAPHRQRGPCRDRGPCRRRDRDPSVQREHRFLCRARAHLCKYSRGPLFKQNRGASAETGAPVCVGPSIIPFVLIGFNIPIGVGAPSPVPLSYDRGTPQRQRGPCPAETGAPLCKENRGHCRNKGPSVRI